MSNKKILGRFTSMKEVWAAYPDGGVADDTVVVGNSLYYWNTGTANWETSKDKTTTGWDSLNIDGDLLVENDLHVGGTLHADKLKSSFKGLFKTVEQLQQAFPKPDVGDYADVGYNNPQRYICEIGGQWKNSGQAGGTPPVVLPEFIELQKAVGSAGDSPDIDGSAFARIAQNAKVISDQGSDINDLQINVGEVDDTADKDGSAFARIAQNSEDINTINGKVSSIGSTVATQGATLTEQGKAIAQNEKDIKALQEEHAEYNADLITALKVGSSVEQAFIVDGEYRLPVSGDTLTSSTMNGIIVSSSSVQTKGIFAYQIGTDITVVSFNKQTKIVTAISVSAIGSPEDSADKDGSAFARINELSENAVGQKTASGGEIFNDLEYNTATGENSHAEGRGSKANGDMSHAEGSGSANGNFSHAEGRAYANGNTAHAEGSSIADGDASHAEGYSTNSKGDFSHTEGYYTITNNINEHASGQYNKSTTSGTDSATAWKGDNVATLFSIGNGTSDSDRKNAFEVKQDGTILIQKPTTDKTLNLQETIDSIQEKQKEIEDVIYPLSVQVSGGGLFEKGTSADITVRWTVKKGSSVITADSVTVNDVDAQGTSKVFNDVSATTKYTVKATKDGKQVSGSTTATFIAPIYFGFAQADAASGLDITSLGKQSLKTSPNGTYSLNNNSDENYLWLCVPSSMNIASVKSGGFDVPMEASQSKATTVDTYKCYRSSSKINSGVMNIVIA